MIAKTKNGGRSVRIVEGADTLDERITGRPSSIGGLGEAVQWVLGNSGNKFLLSTNRGDHWESRSLPDTARIRDIAFVDEKKMLALTSDGIFRSNDKGLTWERISDTGRDGISLYKLPNTGGVYSVGTTFEKVAP